MKIRATRLQIDDFLQGILWKDMQRELKSWKRDRGKMYDDAETAKELHIIQGQREAIDYMLDLPGAIKQMLEDQILEDQENDSRRNTTG